MRPRGLLLAGAMAAFGLAGAVRRIGDEAEVVIDLTPSGGFRSPEPHRHSSGSPAKPITPGNNTPHQGEREKARRRRHLERQAAKAHRSGG